MLSNKRLEELRAIDEENAKQGINTFLGETLEEREENNMKAISNEVKPDIYGQYGNVLPQEVRTLGKLLIAFGGHRACLDHNEPDLEDIMKRGGLFNGSNASVEFMHLNQGHRNAAILWRNDKDSLQLATGYSLCEDGIWRQDSWVVDNEGIIETTVHRELYFGYILRPDEAEKFCRCNI